MDKITFGYKFPHGVITGSESDKAEWTRFITANYNKKELIKKLFGPDNVVHINPSLIWDAKNESTELSFIVNSATDETITQVEIGLSKVFEQVPKYRGGQVYVNVEKDISIADPTLINFNDNKNNLNNNLPRQDLFSYFNQLSFSVDSNNEIYTDNDTSVEKYYNNGSIAMISSAISDMSWYNYQKIFYQLPANGVRLMEPGFHLAIDGGMFYAEFRNTSGEVGLPFIVDLYNPNVLIDDNYFKIFIDQIKVLIETGKQKNLSPTKIIRLEDRLRDSTGYYFKYIEFGSTANNTFIDNQTNYLSEFLDSLPEITNKSSILDYARAQWLH
jgi:hypothetical protein